MVTKCTVRDQSYPPASVETWQYIYRNQRRVGLAVTSLEAGSDTIQGAALPVREARRLIETMSRICDEIEGEK